MTLADHLRIADDGTVLTAESRPEAPPSVVLILGVWQLGWAAGLLAALWLILSGEIGLLLIVWTLGWIPFGLVSGMLLLWLLKGREILAVSPQGLAIIREMPGFRRERQYPAARISAIALQPPSVAETLPNRQKTLSTAIFAGFTQGMVRIEGANGTLGFGPQLPRAEATPLAARIAERLGVPGPADPDADPE